MDVDDSISVNRTIFFILFHIFSFFFHILNWLCHDCFLLFFAAASWFFVRRKFDQHDIPYDVLWLDIEHTDSP